MTVLIKAKQEEKKQMEKINNALMMVLSNKYGVDIKPNIKEKELLNKKVV